MYEFVALILLALPIEAPASVWQGDLRAACRRLCVLLELDGPEVTPATDVWGPGDIHWLRDRLWWSLEMPHVHEADRFYYSREECQRRAEDCRAAAVLWGRAMLLWQDGWGAPWERCLQQKEACLDLVSTWEMLANAKDDGYAAWGRRNSLLHLRQKIGEQNFAAGIMPGPPCIPVDPWGRPLPEVPAMNNTEK
jgi:hypothetical protein